jgi:hypothetical protein
MFKNIYNIVFYKKYKTKLFAKKIIINLRNLLQYKTIILLNEKKIVKHLNKKLYKLNYNTFLNNDVNKNEEFIIKQFVNYFLGNLFIYNKENYIKFEINESDYELNDEKIEKLVNYYKNNSRLKVVNSTFFVSYYISKNLENILKNIDFKEILNKINNYYEINIL